MTLQERLIISITVITALIISLINTNENHNQYNTINTMQTQIDSLKHTTVALSDSLTAVSNLLLLNSKITLQHNNSIKSNGRINTIQTNAIKSIFKHLVAE